MCISGALVLSQGMDSFLLAEVGWFLSGPSLCRLLDQKWGLVFHGPIPLETYPEKWRDPCS